MKASVMSNIAAVAGKIFATNFTSSFGNSSVGIKLVALQQDHRRKHFVTLFAVELGSAIAMNVVFCQSFFGHDQFATKLAFEQLN